MQPDDRRRFSRRGAMAGLGALGAAACAGLPSGGANKPANVVVILADDLGWSDLGCYGSEIATPHLDRLAEGGTRFTRFYNTSKCYTTRAALLTGVYQHEAGIGGLISRADRPLTTGPYQGYLDPAVPTLAELLKAGGYRSHVVGKWHVGERPQHWPMQRGFDGSFGLISGATSYYEVLQEEGRVRQMVRDDQPWTPPDSGFYATDAYTADAVGRIRTHHREHAGSPLFLYLAYTAPHWPLHAPEERIARWLPVYAAGWEAVQSARSARARAMGLAHGTPAARPSDVPAWREMADQAAWARRMAVHAAMVEIMDEGIGAVVAALRDTGRLDNTMLVFLSDNGASHEDVTARGQHQAGSVIGARGSFDAIRAPWAWASNAPFRGTKETVFEGGINTPAILHWPARLGPRGTIRRDPVHVVDLVPTALEGAGLAPPRAGAPALRGRSLLAGPDPDRAHFFEIFESRALIEGPWKALRHKQDTGWSLYNLDDDPAEAIDLSAAEPARLEAMRQRWLLTARAIGVRGLGNEG
jgi:arylsulfatase